MCSVEGTLKTDLPRHQQDIITPKKWRQFASPMRGGRKCTNISKRGLGSGWRKWSMSCFYPAYWSGIPRRLNNDCPETSVWQRSCWLIFYFCFGKGLPLFTFRMQLINTQPVSFPLLLPDVYKQMKALPASSLVRALWVPCSGEEPQGRHLRRKSL